MAARNKTSSELRESISAASRQLQGRGGIEAAEHGAAHDPTLKTVDTFRAAWKIDIDDVKPMIEAARKLASSCMLFEWSVGAKRDFFSAGFSFQPNLAEWKRQLPSYPWQKLVYEVWGDFLACQNVVAFWREREPGNAPLPVITLLRAEDVEYNNAFGVESLKFRPKKRKLSEAEREKLGPRYANAIEKGETIELSEDEGEYFKVLTTAKLGEGFGMPRVKSVLQELSAWELFRIGDWNGAWARRNLVRHGRKGHEIKAGQNAGQPIYFIKKDFAKKMLKELSTQSGFKDIVTNWDVFLDYVYLNPEFFDPKTRVTTAEALDRWMGAVAYMLRDGTPSPYLPEMLRAEGTTQRALVGEFLEQIFNHAAFLGETKPEEPIRIKWDETIYWNARLIAQWVSTGLQNGLCAPQTARAAMRFDDAEESGLLRDAHTRIEDFTPVFEANQGLVSGGGQRVTDNPGGRPQNSER